MDQELTIEVNPENEWRLETPGATGWAKSARPGSADKYFIVSCDSHLGPPASLTAERIEPEYRDRVPRIERDKDGVLWQVTDGAVSYKIMDMKYEGEDQYRSRSGVGLLTEDQTHRLDKRMRDCALDGIDAELVFPNGAGLYGFWTRDAALSQAIFRVYNDWALELTRPYRHRMNVAMSIATADVESAVAEVRRVAKAGARMVLLPNKPVFGSTDAKDPSYNLPMFDPLWAAIQDAGLMIAFHVSTGNDPRGVKGPGGAITNAVIHSFAPVMEPVTNLCSSGVFDRFPKLRFVSVEAGAGWVPWLLDMMDEVYRKHHFWVFPKLKHGMPSDYWRAHGAAEFAEDRAVMALVEQYRLEDNLVWGSDYPHHEGTFPHSAEAIERQMGGLSERARAKILGLNAARMFGFEVPPGMR
jgi:predicted TIM-barrel fold metal-dependent hydrolase